MCKHVHTLSLVFTGGMHIHYPRQAAAATPAPQLPFSEQRSGNLRRISNLWVSECILRRDASNCVCVLLAKVIVCITAGILRFHARSNNGIQIREQDNEGIDHTLVVCAHSEIAGTGKILTQKLD